MYQATNWLYTGQGRAEPVWLTPDGKVLSYTRRHIDVKAKQIGLEVFSLIKRRQVGKHRYVFFSGSKSFKRRARLALKYETFAYPKGPTARHTECALEIGK